MKALKPSAERTDFLVVANSKHALHAAASEKVRLHNLATTRGMARIVNVPRVPTRLCGLWMRPPDRRCIQPGARGENGFREGQDWSLCR